MAPQLQLNQGPQDALLYDNTRSYFTNVGYVRTSNFQLDLQDVEPQSAASFGSTAQFIIPKAADLLGPLDLMVEFEQSTGLGSAINNDKAAFVGWVESVGYAMIEHITFAVGSHDVERISGDQLYLINELMRSDEHRFAKHIGKTGRPLVRANCSGSAWSPVYDTDTLSNSNNRLIANRIDASGVETSVHYDGKKLIIPLGLFFTKHPSVYFPLAAIAGCNDIRISIKFRSYKELIQIVTNQTVGSGAVTTAAPLDLSSAEVPTTKMKECFLRAHFIHVTGPEAAQLSSKEHVRLLKLWGNPHQSTRSLKGGGSSSGGAYAASTTLFDLELPFLHPVQELVIIIRKTSEMSDSVDATAVVGDYDKKARTKNYFAFHGGGKDPNIDSQRNMTKESSTSVEVEHYLKVDNFKLTLNGQERHSALSKGLSRDYLIDRLMPMIHSNTSTTFMNIQDNHQDTSGSVTDFTQDDFKALGEMFDRKEIYVYPFALNPEGANPSGAVNFSKVSHAKLRIEGQVYSSVADTNGVEYRCEVWGVHYNWLAIKDGRAITSFA
jgi:hypothetical protein